MFKKIWGYIAAAFALVVGLFFIERRKRLGAETRLENSEVLKTDAVLENDQKHLANDISNQEANIAEKVKQHNEKVTPSLKPEEVEDYWKNKRKD